MAKKLKSFTVILTQPAESLKSLSSGLNAIGIKTLDYPLIRLRKPMNWHLVDEAWKNLEIYNCVVFVSPYAAEITLRRWWHVAQKRAENDFHHKEKNLVWHEDALNRFPPIALMGASSYLVCCFLGLAKCTFLLPEQPCLMNSSDAFCENKGSEYLWPSIYKFLQMNSLLGKQDVRIAFLKGSEGRGWLINRLMNTNVKVDEIISYRREFIDWPNKVWEETFGLRVEGSYAYCTHQIGFFFTSSDALRHFCSLIANIDAKGLLIRCLQWVPIVVTQKRIAEEAKKNNFHMVKVCSASVDSVCESFFEYSNAIF